MANELKNIPDHKRDELYEKALDSADRERNFLNNRSLNMGRPSRVALKKLYG